MDNLTKGGIFVGKQYRKLGYIEFNNQGIRRLLLVREAKRSLGWKARIRRLLKRRRRLVLYPSLLPKELCSFLFLVKE